MGVSRGGMRGEDRSELGFGLEGHHEMLMHSRAWAENEWRDRF